MSKCSTGPPSAPPAAIPRGFSTAHDHAAHPGYGMTADRGPPDERPISVGSAGDVKDRADLPWLEARDQSAGLFRRDSDEVNVSARSLLHHLRHDRQRAVGPGADDQAVSAPGELFVDRERSVSELVAVWLRGLLAPFAYITSVDDDVVLIRSSVDLDRPESEKSHIHYVPPYPSTARAQASRNSYPTSWPPSTRRSGVK